MVSQWRTRSNIELIFETIYVLRVEVSFQGLAQYLKEEETKKSQILLTITNADLFNVLLFINSNNILARFHIQNGLHFTREGALIIMKSAKQN